MTTATVKVGTGAAEVVEERKALCAIDKRTILTYVLQLFAGTAYLNIRRKNVMTRIGIVEMDAVRNVLLIQVGSALKMDLLAEESSVETAIRTAMRNATMGT